MNCHVCGGWSSLLTVTLVIALILSLSKLLKKFFLLPDFLHLAAQSCLTSLVFIFETPFHL